MLCYYNNLILSSLKMQDILYNFKENVDCSEIHQEVDGN